MPDQISLDDFDLFWGAYPRKAGKGQARRAFGTALRKTSFHTILTAIDAQRGAGMFQDMTYIPYPATWLNGERWTDEIVPRERPAFRNGAMELLAREAEAGMLIDAEPGNLLR